METVARSLVIRKMSPKTLIRFAATIKAARNETAVERRQIAALKRILHRRALRHNERFFEAPPPRFPGLRWRLAGPLFTARIAAYDRARLSPGRKKASIKKARWMAARAAYGRYATVNHTNEGYNRFLRVHAKRGLEPPVNRRAAAIMYN